MLQPLLTPCSGNSAATDLRDRARCARERPNHLIFRAKRRGWLARCLNASRATSRSRSGCRATSARSSARDLLAGARRLGGARAAGRRVRGARRRATRGRALRPPSRRACSTPSSAPAASSTSARARRSRSPPQRRSSRSRRRSRPRSTRRSSPRSRFSPGSCSLVAGALRLGFVAEFLARPVLIGFISGIGVVIIVGQLPKLLGLTGRERQRARDALARRSSRSTRSAGQTPLVGCASLAALLVAPPPRPAGAVGARRRRGRGRRSAAPSTSQAHGVAVIADVPGGPADARAPGRSASARSARSAAARSRSRSSRSPSRSAPRARSPRSAATRSIPTRSSSRSAPSNIGAGLLQGFPVDASLSRSAVGAGAGVRTRLSGLFVALLLVATMLFLTPLFDGLPQATLAAIIIAAVIGLVDVRGFRWLWRIDQGDARLAIVGFAAVALLGVLPGIVVAVVASLLALIRRAYRPRIAVLGRVPRRGERRRELPLPQHRPAPRVRDDPGPRPLPVLERAVLRQRVVLPRRDAAARRRVGSARAHRSRRRLRDQPRSTRPRSRCSTTCSTSSSSEASRSSSPARRRDLDGRSRRARASATGSGPSAFHRSVHAGVESFLRRPRCGR